MEPDFHRQFGGRGIVSTARILLEDVTREAELRMLSEDLPRAVKLIRTMAPGVVVFGCTSAGALGDLSHDARIAGTIAEGTGARVVTVLGAALAKIEVVRPKRLAVLTPYLEELTTSIVSSLTLAGYPPVRAAGMGIRANLEIGCVEPSRIISFVVSQLDGCSPDCVFLSCTNWQAIPAIEPLQQKLGIPVITSNQAAIDAVSLALV
jgi:maleate isomerase